MKTTKKFFSFSHSLSLSSVKRLYIYIYNGIKKRNENIDRYEKKVIQRSASSHIHHLIATKENGLNVYYLITICTFIYLFFYLLFSFRYSYYKQSLVNLIKIKNAFISSTIYKNCLYSIVSQLYCS